MTRDQKIGAAIFASGVAVAIWGQYNRRKDSSSSAARAALYGGSLLTILGMYRIDPAAGAGAAVGGGVYFGLLALKGPCKKYLATNCCEEGDSTCDAVRAALEKEKDPTVLHDFATKLRAANYVHAADVIEKRALEITPTARVGQEMSVVAEVQARLRDLGYDVPQDGRMGPATELAIKRFQSLHDLDIDGQIGAETLRALRAATAVH